MMKYKELTSAIEIWTDVSSFADLKLLVDEL